MKPAVARSLGVVATLALLACGADTEAGPSAPTSSGDDRATDDSAPDRDTPAGGTAQSDPTEAALAAGLHIEEFEGVQFFWAAPDGYNQALLLPTQPVIENGCLVVGLHVIVWYSTDVSVARRLITALQVGDAVDEMSLGGGEAPTSSPFVPAIRERCGTESVWGAGPLDD